ncbi:MAG: (Fe-S)-binding protein [Dehalococcoidia bacterium]
MTEIVTPFKEGVEAAREAGGEAFRFCYQCGLCDTVCPWNRVRSFSIRKIIRQTTFGLPEIEGEEIWRCTTCGSCPQRCPRGVETIDVSVSLRRIASEAGITPAPIHTVNVSVGTEGNPLREPRDKRTDWAKGLPVKPFTEGMEVLYFPCCYLSYDSRTRRLATATAHILNKAEVDFGILGPEQNCCGESVRKTGDEGLFRQLAKGNIKTFIDSGVKKILVASPHCYHTFKNEYPEFMVNFEVIHISQYLLQLINEGRLELTREYGKKVTYHDPCYLGRHNGIYDEPREVLRRVPGLELIEMAESREDSLCCGGGGGGIWMDVSKGERFSDLRVAQAVETGAEALVTSCPYCIINFEDSKLSMEDSEVIDIKDITEIIQEVI